MNDRDNCNNMRNRCHMVLASLYYENITGLKSVFEVMMAMKINLRLACMLNRDATERIETMTRERLH